MAERLLTPDQVAERLQVPKSWVYERTRRNALPGLVRLGGKYVRIKESALQTILDAATPDEVILAGSGRF